MKYFGTILWTSSRMSLALPRDARWKNFLNGGPGKYITSSENNWITDVTIERFLEQVIVRTWCQTLCPRCPSMHWPNSKRSWRMPHLTPTDGLSSPPLPATVLRLLFLFLCPSTHYSSLLHHVYKYRMVAATYYWINVWDTELMFETLSQLRDDRSDAFLTVTRVNHYWFFPAVRCYYMTRKFPMYPTIA